MSRISLLISTCDKFSDLWTEHITSLKKHWKGEMWKVYMVTDKKTDRQFEGIEIIVAGEDKDFPMRIKYAVEHISSDYILLTLDDYFIINDINVQNLEYLVNRVEKDKISYLKLYDRRKINSKKYDPIEKIVPIDLTQKYAITLYPAVWERNFLFQSVFKDMTAWMYEPSLTEYARNSGMKCMFSHTGTFDILDVVRKGEILHKANNYFKKNNINIGDRPLISLSTEIILVLMDRISWYTPRKVFITGKKILRKFGKTFYSED